MSFFLKASWWDDLKEKFLAEDVNMLIANAGVYDAKAIHGNNEQPFKICANNYGLILVPVFIFKSTQKSICIPWDEISDFVIVEESHGWFFKSAIINVSFVSKDLPSIIIRISEKFQQVLDSYIIKVKASNKPPS